MEAADGTVDDATVGWAEVLSATESRLGEAGLRAVEARWIVEQASGLDLGAGDALAKLVTVGGMARLDGMVARRLAGEPLQYVLGSWSFRTLDLMVDRRVLIPRPETEAVVGHALDELDRLAARGGQLLVADLGTGSGAIGLSIAAERVAAMVWCTDASGDALAVARANLAGLGRPARRVTIAEGSWFGALPADLAGSLDLVVSNPPYVAIGADLPAGVAEWEPEPALLAGPAGTEHLEEIIRATPAWLGVGGSLVLEISPEQAGTVARMAVSAGLVDVEVRPDLAGRDRALVARQP